MADAREMPEIRAVLLCERIIEEKDGVLSVIRMIDNLTVVAQGAGAPNAMPQVPLQFWALISLKAGNAQGDYSLGVVIRSPSGKPSLGEMPVMPARFDAPDAGVNFMVQVNLVPREEGLFWFEVTVEGEGRPLARIPFRVLYVKQSQTPSGEQR